MTERDRTAELKTLAHDVRNALNGVAVNLEVARSRVQRGASITDLGQFLETAALQLDLATRLHKRYTDAAIGLAHEELQSSVRSRARPADDTPSHT
ncbi:MAG: hypothetical protein M3R65_12245 [Gemmatimonadota bacterium]|nr:hypothetical protein [Gemmatimonadota bacterium]